MSVWQNMIHFPQAVGYRNPILYSWSICSGKPLQVTSLCSVGKRLMVDDRLLSLQPGVRSWSRRSGRNLQNFVFKRPQKRPVEPLVERTIIILHYCLQSPWMFVPKGFPPGFPLKSKLLAGSYPAKWEAWMSFLQRPAQSLINSYFEGKLLNISEEPPE